MLHAPNPSSARSSLPARKHCSRCGRWKSILDFRPRAWDADGCIKWVQPDCDYCHSRQSKRWYVSLSPEVKRLRVKASSASHARSRRKRRLDKILREAKTRPKGKITVKKDVHWKREGIESRDLLADARGDYLWAVHHSLKIIPHNPAMVGHPMSAEFHAMSADLECKHGTCPGDARPQPGCPGYNECLGL